MIELQTSVKQDDTTHTRLPVHRSRGILTSLMSVMHTRAIKYIIVTCAVLNE